MLPCRAGDPVLVLPGGSSLRRRGSPAEGRPEEKKEVDLLLGVRRGRGRRK